MQDIYRDGAAAVLNKPREEVTKEERNRFKVALYNTLYQRLLDGHETRMSMMRACALVDAMTFMGVPDDQIRSTLAKLAEAEDKLDANR